MEKKCQFYVYIITNNISGKQYVGSRMCYDDPSTDNYMGSSKYLKEDYEINGINNFQKEILHFYEDKEQMLNSESFHILKYNTLSPNGYNRYLPNTHPGFHMGGTEVKEETKNKIRSKLSGENHPNWGRHLSQKTRDKIGKSNEGKTAGRIMDQKTKDKIGSANKISLKDHHPSEKTKEKIKNSNLGVKRSDVTKNKIKGKDIYILSTSGITR